MGYSFFGLWCKHCPVKPFRKHVVVEAAGSEGRLAILRKEGLPGVSGEGLPRVSGEGLPFLKRKACLRSQRKSWYSHEGRLALGLKGRLGILRKEVLPGVSGEGLSFSKRKACLRFQGSFA